MFFTTSKLTVVIELYLALNRLDIKNPIVKFKDEKDNNKKLSA